MVAASVLARSHRCVLRSLQMMLKRQHIADQSNQQMEDKRNSLLMHQEDVRLARSMQEVP